MAVRATPVRTKMKGEVWGDFEVFLDDLIGRGGMGVVYRARQISLDRSVAVKVLQPKNDLDPGLMGGFVEKFLSESRALGQLNDPRIVHVIQAGQNNGQFWFAMELVEGETVSDRLSREGAFSEEETVRIALEVAQALGAAARREILHCDIKPENIFLTSDGGVKVGDWGLARRIGSHSGELTDLHHLACTPAYTAPERAKGEKGSYGVDQYSLGVVMYEMLAEQPPFHSDGPMGLLFRHVNEPIPSLRTFNPKVSEELETILLKMLAKRPEDRYSSHTALIEALQEFQIQSTKAEVATNTESTHPTAKIILTTFGMGLLAFLVWAVTQFESSVPTQPQANIAPISQTEASESEPPSVPTLNLPQNETEESDSVTIETLPDPPPKLPEYVPTTDDFEFVKTLLAIYEKGHQDLHRRKYGQLATMIRGEIDRHPQTPFTKKLGNSALQMLISAQNVYATQIREWGETREPITIQTKQGERIQGTIQKADRDGFTIRNSNREIRIQFAELSTDDFIDPIQPTADHTAFLIANCDREVSLSSLLEDVEEVRSFWLPAYLRLHRLHVHQSILESPDTFRNVVLPRKEILERYPYTHEDFKNIEREEVSLRLFRQEQYRSVLLMYSDTACRHHAERIVFDRARANFHVNFFDPADEAHYCWAPDSDSIWEPDSSKGMPLLSSEGERASVFSTEHFANVEQGFMLTLRMEPTEERVSYGELGLDPPSTYLKFSRHSVSFYHSDHRLAHGILDPISPDRWITLLVVPHQNYLLLFANQHYLFPLSISTAKIPSRFRVSVLGGRAWLKEFLVQ